MFGIGRGRQPTASGSVHISGGRNNTYNVTINNTINYHEAPLFIVRFRASFGRTSSIPVRGRSHDDVESQLPKIMAEAEKRGLLTSDKNYSIEQQADKSQVPGEVSILS